MKSKNNSVIEVRKCVNIGYFPLFVSAGQRHLEKGSPEPIEGCERTYQVPVDVMRLSVSNPALLEGIDSIEFSYRAK